MSDVVDLLADLVRIDSTNPSLVPDAAGEAEIAAFVAGWAGRHGLAVEIIEGLPGRPNVIVRGGRRTGGRTLLLCGHLDTVGAGTMVDPLGPRVVADRMYGRGTYDMKAGLAAALIACREAAAAGIDGEVVVAAVADEEHSSEGVQQVLPHLQAHAAIVMEPTELGIALSHKGFVWTEIAVQGQAAHGSRPQLGVDAILKAGPILVALERLNQELARRPHPSLGPGSLHGSLISGGIEESTIPDRCVLTVERRTLPGETVGDVEREVFDLLAHCRAGDPELVVTSRTTLAREPFETAPDAIIVEPLATAAAQVLGRPAELTAMSYWADSAFIAAAGIPTVLFGPDGDGAHAEVEWVSLRGTADCARVLTRAALAFCR